MDNGGMNGIADRAITNGLAVVTDGGLDEDGRSLISQADNLGAQVKRLGNFIAELLSEWQGEAANNLNTSWGEMQGALQELADTLGSKGVSLVQNAGTFEDAENSNAALFERINN